MSKGTVLSLLESLLARTAVKGQVASVGELGIGESYRVFLSLSGKSGRWHPLLHQPLTLLLWVASNPYSAATGLVRTPASHPSTLSSLHLLGLGGIYCQWLWLISHCLWPDTGCVQIAPQRVGRCGHLPFLRLFPEIKRTDIKCCIGGGAVGGYRAS